MSDDGGPLLDQLIELLAKLTLQDNLSNPERYTTGEDFAHPETTPAGLQERIVFYQAQLDRRRRVKYAPHDRMIFTGTIGAASETFSFSLNGHFFAPDSGDRIDPAREDRQAWLTTKVAPLATSWFADAKLAIGASTKLTKLSLARIGEDGKYEAGQVPAFLPVNVGGGAAGAGFVSHPWQVSLAVSLSCATATTTQGRRGRFYLPCTAFGVDGSTNKLNPNDAMGVATRTKTFLDGVNAAVTGIAGAAWEFRLYGDGVRKNAPDVTGPTNRVTSLRVGDVLDTIRSRRNAAAETYSLAALA